MKHRKRQPLVTVVDGWDDVLVVNAAPPRRARKKAAKAKLKDETFSSQRADPSRTLPMRAAFVRQLRLQFAALKDSIAKQIGEQDILGLVVNAEQLRDAHGRWTTGSGTIHEYDAVIDREAADLLQRGEVTTERQALSKSFKKHGEWTSTESLYSKQVGETVKSVASQYGTPKEANFGHCDEVAYEAHEHLSERGIESKIGWGATSSDELSEGGGVHAYLSHGSKHYDAENPEGVDHPSKLEFFKRNGGLQTEDVLNDLHLDVQLAAQRADASPTEAQRSAGNYRHGHVVIQGIPITIETAKGVKRKPHHDKVLAAHYGYIKRTESEADGDHIDVFIGSDPESQRVWVIDQRKATLNAQARDERGRWIGTPTSEHEEAISKALAGMTPGFRDKALKSLFKIVPYTSTEAMARARFGHKPYEAAVSAGTYRESFGSFNNDDKELNLPLSSRIHDVVAHELSHAADSHAVDPYSSGSRLSDSEDWKSAWHKEFEHYDGDDFPRGRDERFGGRVVATVSPSEAFAEYGRAKIQGVDLSKKFPASHAAWQKLVEELAMNASEFDEHKCMLGFGGEEQAVQAYRDSYPDGWQGFGGITELTVEQFKRWLEDGDTSKPMQGQTINSNPEGRNQYTDKSAAEHYSLNGKSINKKLRKGEQPDDHVKALDKLISEKSTKHDELWRGEPTNDDPMRGKGAELVSLSASERTSKVNKLTEEYVKQKFKVGEEFSDHGFTSASKEPAAAIDAALSKESAGYLMKIIGGHGADLSKVSKFDDEHEVLLPRKSKFKVKSVAEESVYDFANDRDVRRMVVTVEHRPTITNSSSQETYQPFVTNGQMGWFPVTNAEQVRDELGRFAGGGAKKFSSDVAAEKAFTDTTEKLFGEKPGNQWHTHILPGDQHFIKTSTVLREDQHNIRLDFGTYGLEYDEQNAELSSGSLTLMREVGRAIKGYKEAGFNIEIHPADDKRREVFDRLLSRAGMTKVQDMDEKHRYQVWNTLTVNECAPLVEVPTVRQDNHWRCGPACVTSVLQSYGIAAEEDAVSDELGTTEQKSTDPQAIWWLLREKGLHPVSQSYMSLEALSDAQAAGEPVIVCVQDYMGRRSAKAEFQYGHYLVVLGRYSGYVFCMDPSLENWASVKGGDVKDGQDANLDAPGRVMIREEDFLDAWHDVSTDGTKYIRFGIRVGRGSLQNVNPEGCNQHTGPGCGEGGKQEQSHAEIIKAKLASARQRLRDFQAKLDKATDVPVVKQVKVAQQVVTAKAKQLHAAMENRYGRTAAIAIMLSGQAIGWGALGLGAMAGIPLWLPGVSLWGAIPGAAMAEAGLQAYRGARKLKQALTKNAVVDIDAEALTVAKQVHQHLLNWINRELTVNDATDKLTAFQAWLDEQLDKFVLGKTQEQLWDEYIRQGFAKGAGRAFDDANKPYAKGYASDDSTKDFYDGSKEEFLRSSFGQPIAREKVELMSSATFDELEGVTEEMAQDMSRLLTEGLVQGRNPHDVAVDIAEQTDMTLERAERIAQHEFSKVHAEGQLIALESLGITEVGVAVEWLTSGRVKCEDLPAKMRKGSQCVCPRCAALEGVVLKTSEAHGLLPLHIGCYCSYIPAGVGEDDGDQIVGKKAIDAALKEAGIDPDKVGISVDRPVGNWETWNVRDRDELGRWASAAGQHAVSLHSQGFTPRRVGEELLVKFGGKAKDWKSLTEVPPKIVIDAHRATATAKRGAESEKVKAPQLTPQPSAAEHSKHVVEAVLKHGGDMVSMAKVRRHLTEQGVMDREDQDAAIQHARGKHVTGSNLEGRFGISDEERESALRVGDDRIGYLSLKR